LFFRHVFFRKKKQTKHFFVFSVRTPKNTFNTTTKKLFDQKLFISIKKKYKLFYVFLDFISIFYKEVVEKVLISKKKKEKIKLRSRSISPLL